MSEKTALERLYEDTNSLHNDGSQYSVEDLLDMDYEQAILSGANMVRIGSRLFGPRIYR